NASPGLAHSGIIEGDPDQPLRATLQGTFQDGAEQLLRFPLAARMQKVFRAPTAILTAIGPDNTGQTAAPQAHQGAERLTHGTFKGALLGKDAAPLQGNGEE